MIAFIKASTNNKRSTLKMNQRQLSSHRRISTAKAEKSDRKSKESGSHKSRQNTKTSRLSVESISPKENRRTRDRSLVCCGCLDVDDSDSEIKKRSVGSRSKSKSQKQGSSKRDLRASVKSQDKSSEKREALKNQKTSKISEIFDLPGKIEATIEKKEAEKSLRDDKTEDNPPAEADPINGNLPEGTELVPSMTSGEQLLATETEETSPDQLRKDNLMQFKTEEVKQEMVQQAEKKKTYEKPSEFEEPTLMDEEVYLVQIGKRRQDLIPFFLTDTKPVRKMNHKIFDNWFKSINNCDSYTKSSNFLYEEKDFTNMFDERDELLGLFQNANNLGKELSSKELKFHSEISNMKDVRKQLRNLKVMSSMSRVMSDVSNQQHQSSFTKNRASKISRSSSRWLRQKSGLEILNNFNKKWKDTAAVSEEQVSIREGIKTPIVTTNVTESIESPKDMMLSIHTNNPYWSIAKESAKSTEFMTKRNKMKEEFIKNLEKDVDYPGPTFGKYRMPIANFKLSLPLPNPSSVGSFQLQELYKRHFSSLVTNGEAKYFPSLKFINPNHLSIAINKDTEGLALLGVGDRTVIAGGYLQNCEINESDIFIDESGLSIKNSLVENYSSEGHIAVAIKIYRSEIPRASAVDFLREAALLHYISKNVKAASPQYLGIVNLNPSSSFLSFGLVTLLVGDPENFEVVTLDRLLWQEIQSRSEHKIELDNWRWIKILLNLTKLIHRLHRKLIVVNNIKMNSIIMRYIPGKGWTSPKITNFSKAYISRGLGNCLLNKKEVEPAKPIHKNLNDARSYEEDISALGCVIRDVNLSLGLGLEGIVEYIQPHVPIKEYWTTCELIDALEGAMIEERNNSKYYPTTYNQQEKKRTNSSMAKKTKSSAYSESVRKSIQQNVLIEKLKIFCSNCYL